MWLACHTIHGLWGRIVSCAPVVNRCWAGCLQAIRAGYQPAGPRGYPCQPAPQFLPDFRFREKYVALGTSACATKAWLMAKPQMGTEETPSSLGFSMPAE